MIINLERCECAGSLSPRALDSERMKRTANDSYCVIVNEL